MTTKKTCAMQPAVREWLGLLCMLVTAVGCSEGPFVKVYLDGRQEDVIRIGVTLDIADKSVSDREFGNNPDLSVFAVNLPRGIRGSLKMSVKGYLVGGCQLASGSGSLEVADDIVYETRILLKEISTCGQGTFSLSVVKDPPESGTVTSIPAGIDCGGTCSALFRENTKIKLTATAIPGSAAIGWADVPGCDKGPTCEVTIKENLIARAQFDGCKGWCDETPTISRNTLYGVFGNRVDNIYAVGVGGTILYWDGNRWSSKLSSTTETLRGVGLINSTTNYFAVGDKGTIRYQGGAGWNIVTAQSTGQLNGVAGHVAAEMFAVGSNGTYLKGGQGGFDPVTASNCEDAVRNKTLNAIATARSGNESFVVGSGGLMMRRRYLFFDDYCTTMMASGITTNLLGVWMGASYLFVVGEQGTIVRCKTDGSACTKQLMGLTTVLRAIWGTSTDGVLYAVGDGGTILRSVDSGVTWTAEKSNTSKQLNAIWGVDANTVYVVGEGGTILRYR